MQDHEITTPHLPDPVTVVHAHTHPWAGRQVQTASSIRAKVTSKQGEMERDEEKIKIQRDLKRKIGKDLKTKRKGKERSKLKAKNK